MNDDGLLICVANLAVVIESDSVSVGLGMIFFFLVMWLLRSARVGQRQWLTV